MIINLLSGNEIKEKFKGDEYTIICKESTYISSYGIYIIKNIKEQEGKTIVFIDQCLPSAGVVEAVKEIF